MNITAYFSNEGSAATGLTPTVTVVALPGTVVVNAQTMSAIANAPGWYLYDFSAFDSTKDYVITADAGSDTVDDRYPTAVSSSDEIETGYSTKDILKIISSVLAGKMANDGETVTFRDINDTVTRVSSGVSETGRDSVSINV